MSRALSTFNISPNRVAYGQYVTTQVATNVGFNAGDYVYTYNNGTIGNLGSTIELGVSQAYIAGVLKNGGPQSFAPSSVLLGPFAASGTYTNATRTVQTVFQTPSTITTNNNATVKTCVLNNKNVAILFRDTVANDLKIAIFDSSGSQILAPTFVSNTSASGVVVGTSVGSIDIAAMYDGGFVVAYCTGQESQYYVRRYDSSGNSLLSQTTITTGGVVVTSVAVASSFYGTWLAAGAPTAGLSRYRFISATNVIANEVVFSNVNTRNIRAVGAPNGDMYVFFYYSAGVALVGSRINGLTGTKIFEVGATSTSTATSFFSVDVMPGSGGFPSFVIVFNNNNSNYPVVSFVSSTNTTMTEYSANNDLRQIAGGGNTISVSYVGNNTVVATYYQSGLYCNILTNTNSTTPTIGAPVQITPAGSTISTISNGSMTPALNGSVYQIYRETTTNALRLITINHATYTQNVTVLTNTVSFIPPNGYYFQGIALTNASAGGIGTICINGAITLPSTYPSVTTPVAFDYQNNSQWAQRGTIVGRSMNLNGAE